MVNSLRKLLPLLLFGSLVLPVGATEPLGISLRQELSASRMLASDSPLRYAYTFLFDWKEPFYSIDSLAAASRTSDFLRFSGSLTASPYLGEIKGGGSISPIPLLGVGGFYSAQIFPKSGNRMVTDSLRHYWNDRSLGQSTWEHQNTDYLQVAAATVFLKGMARRTLLSAEWIIATLDVNTGEGSSAYHYGWELPVQHGDNVISWEASAEHFFGVRSLDKATSLGLRMTLSGATHNTRFFFDPTPDSDDVAQFRTTVWSGIPLSSRFRLAVGGVYSLHSQGGGETVFSDRLGLILRLQWRWNHRSFSLPEW